MNIGGLDRRVTIQRQTHAVNGYGERVKTWIDYATVWANIERKPAATERISGEQVVSFNTVVFMIRNSNNMQLVDTSWRIQYAQKNYEIIGVHEVGRLESLRIITQLLEV